MSVPFHPTLESYEEIANAVMETERGRWFLREHERRTRAADTVVVLEAIAAAERRLAQSATLVSGDACDLESLARRTARLRTILAAVDQPGRLVSRAINQCAKLERAIDRARSGARRPDKGPRRAETSAGADDRPRASKGPPTPTLRTVRAVQSKAPTPDAPNQAPPLKLAASNPIVPNAMPARIAVVPDPVDPDRPAAAKAHVAAAARPQMPKAWTPGLLDDLSAEEAAGAPK